MTSESIETELSVEALAERVSNWGRWGDADQIGTVNLITNERRAAAAASVVHGEVVSLGQPLHLGGTAGPANSVHVVWRAFEPVQAAAEFIGLDFHGPAVTHLDAICHIHRDGKMYNGHSADAVTPRGGSLVLDVASIADRLVGRGVLLDVAAALESESVASAHQFGSADLDRAEVFGQVRVEAGDLVYVRMGGRAVTGSDAAGWRLREEMPGIAPASLEWFRERDVALLATDVAADALPQPPGPWAFAVHQLAIYFMGMPLLDNCELEQISEACKRHGRYEFFCAVAPLSIPGGTGAPVNPLAIF